MNRKSKFIFSTAIAAASIALISSNSHGETFRIEIDYMGSDGAHDHQPSQLVLDTVIEMFACQGHTLIIDLDDEITHCSPLRADPDDCGSFWTYDGHSCSFASIKDANFDHADDDPPWFYCIFAHQYQSLNSADPPVCVTTGSSGRSDGGQNLIVTLGNFDGGTGTEFVQASTLAHEFGHNLGLSHCGTMNCSSNSDNGDPDYVGPFVPNLPSVMSYRYQLVGVRTQALMMGLIPDEALFKDIDFSHGRMCDLDENDLDETLGTTMTPVDWNCSGVFGASVVKDINGDGGGWCDETGNLTELDDYNEWANLQPGVGLMGDGSPAAMQELERRRIELDSQPCITARQWARIQDEIGMPRGSGPPLVVESCITGRNIYLTPSAFVLGTGSCNLPLDSLPLAQAVSPPNSVFYFVDGTYNPPSGFVFDKPGIYLCETGTALIEP